MVDLHSHSVIYFSPCTEVCGILVPQPRIKPVPPALGGQRSLNRWTTRGVPVSVLFLAEDTRKLPHLGTNNDPT